MGQIVVNWDEILSSGANVLIWDDVIIWDEMLSSKTKKFFYHLKLMLSSGTKCYHLG
jgi:hypothetical protein